LPADNILQQIKSAARAELTRQARQARLQDPEFEIAVTPPAQPLAACAQPVTIEMQDARQPNRMRFAVLCGGAGGWRRELLARATVSARVGVLREAVAAGASFGPREVALERRDITQVADAVSDLDLLNGMVSRRTLRAGELLRLNQLVAPQLVKRGAAVRIVGRAAQVEVSVTGEALDNGVMDALVRVRNASSGAVIRARVTGPDTVQPADQPANIQSSD
jgi:flagellar basal body P-ring formation protein FlgA